MSEKFPYVKKLREEVRVIPEKAVPFTRFVIKNFTRFNVWVFRTSKGRLMTTFPGGYPICVVGMKGAKSGARREVGLIHIPKGDDIILIASQGGLDKHPAWYYNVKANPDIDIMIAGGEKKNYIARQLSEAEKGALWPLILSVYPDFDEYQARTDREIPVFLCTPITA
jgi:deazaflavin-dependent oxidoreductase (nitroreductase family)